MRTLIGFVIIILGLGMLLERLEIPGAQAVLNAWWPLVLIAVGVMIWSANRRHWFAPALIVLFGVVSALDQFSVIQQSAWELLWPLVLLLVGVRIALGKNWMNQVQTDAGPATAAVMFSGIDRVVSGPVKSGDISVWFGGAKIDLRQAQFTTDITLAVTAGFGGVELFVPPSVRVVSHIAGVFGGTDDKTTIPAQPIATLTLTGTALFGGVSIKNG